MVIANTLSRPTVNPQLDLLGFSPIISMWWHERKALVFGCVVAVSALLTGCATSPMYSVDYFGLSFSPPHGKPVHS